MGQGWWQGSTWTVRTIATHSASGRHHFRTPSARDLRSSPSTANAPKGSHAHATVGRCCTKCVIAGSSATGTGAPKGSAAIACANDRVAASARGCAKGNPQAAAWAQTTTKATTRGTTTSRVAPRPTAQRHPTS